MKNGVYLVFVHLDGEKMKYGGYFTTRSKAEEICGEYNNDVNKEGWADFINVTDEADDTYLID